MRYILLLIFTSICLLAEVAKVSAVVGDATILRDTKSIIVKIGTLVEEKDIVQTKKNSKVQLIFNDNTIVTLGKNSALNINEYIYDTKNPKNSRTDFNFFKGAFKAITGKIGKVNKEKFKLRTKNSTIGIRGTVILANQTTVMCLSGEISVSAQDNQVIVPQNQVTTVQEDGELSAPTEYTQETLKELSNSLEPQDDADSTQDDATDTNSSEESESNDSNNDEENQEESKDSEEANSDEENTENSNNSDETNNEEESSQESNTNETSENESEQSSNSDESGTAQSGSESTDEEVSQNSDTSTGSDSTEESTLTDDSTSETQTNSSEDQTLDSSSSFEDSETSDTSTTTDTSTDSEIADDSSLQTTNSLDESDSLSTSSTTTDTSVTKTTDTITQTAQEASDDSNETQTEQTTVSFNYRGSSLGAYVESNTTTASTNNFIHQDNTSTDGTVGIFRATRVDNKVSYEENFSRIFANSDKKSISKTLSRTFSLGTPSSGGYTGYSDITDNSNPISFSYTSTGGVNLSGNYKVIVDNMGEVFVLYYDGSAFDVPGGTAEYNELIVFGKNGLINQADKSKIYVYKDLVSMRVEKDSSGNFTESKLDTDESGFEFFNANLKSMTHINKDVHAQGAEEFIAGYDKKIKVYRNKYNFTYNGSVLNLNSYNYGNTEANIELFGTDYQAISYRLSTTDNTKTYSTNTTTSTKSENSGASFLQKDKVQTAKTTGTANLEGFINAEAYGNNTAKTHLRRSSSDLTLEIDRSNGNISGDATLGVTTGSAANGITMKFSGDVLNSTSYYINDDIWGVMADTGNSNYKVGADEYDLGDNTGYLIAVPDGAFVDNEFKLFDSDDNPLTSDDDSSWGYWTGKFSSGSEEVFVSPFATWVAGIETPTSIVQDALDATNNTRYTFEGAVIGTVLNGNTGNLEVIKTDNNSVKMNFDLGGGSNSLTSGTVNFSTANTNWGMNIQGSSVTSSGFSGSLSNSTTGGNSITGSVVGKFYGSDKIKSIGGTVSATQDVASGVAHKAQGVFKALKK